MEPLFRFVLSRPPIERDDEKPSIELLQETPFQEALDEAQGGDAGRDDVKAAARQFADTADFATGVDDLELGSALTTLRSEFDRLEVDDGVDHDTLATSIEAAMGDDSATIVDSQEFDTDVRRLRDSIVTIKLLPEEHQRPLHRLTTALRDLEVIARVASDGAFPADPAALRRQRTVPLELPPSVSLGSTLSLPKTGGDGEEDDQQVRIDDLVNRFEGLTTAIDELGTLDGGKLQQSVSEASPEVLPPEDLRPVALFTEAIKNANDLSVAVAPGYSPRISVGEIAVGRRGDEDRDERRHGTAVVAESDFAPDKGAVEAANSVRKTFAGRAAFTPQKPEEIGFRLAEEGVKSLTAGTRTVLDEQHLNPESDPVDELVDGLRREATRVTDELATVTGRPVEYGLKQYGNKTVIVSTPVGSPAAAIGVGRFDRWLPPRGRRPDQRIPDSHAEITPAGVADLLVVNQQLTGYEAVDISHVENVLQSEGKVRNHRRRRETEEFLLRETEVTTTEERDLESTDRYEMSRETSETIQEDTSLSAGLTVSGKYGPTVEFSATAEGSMSRSKEQATETAATFAKEVTQRSASKITERIKERESLRVTTEVEDSTEHTLDNVSGDDHITGIYQWLEKIYQAQMFNYGLRTMYDFMVPEPGAFLVDALRRSHASTIELEKPLAFPLEPDELTEEDYHFWVHEYGATDVAPPPEIYVTKSLDYSAGNGDDKTDYNYSGQVQIDEGYRAIHATVGVAGNIWNKDCVIDVVIGGRSHRFTNGSSLVWPTALDNERYSIPFGLSTWRISDIAAVVKVLCQRTDRALALWRHDTHAKLTQAYRARLAEYEEKLAALESEAGPEIEGQSPAANQQLMRDELKKNCVSIMSEQHFDLFDAIETGTNGLAQIDLFENEVEGPYVRFFEQAFEWEHLTWVTYPYYWGRKSEWTTRLGFEDMDPMFTEFLRAGYCRVSVPVRAGFEGAVDHFMTTGDVWAGGPLPAISSPQYLPIAEEIAERLDRPGEEIPQGEPWEVRLPTSLVMLKQDPTLPSWEQDEDGNWVPQ